MFSLITVILAVILVAAIAAVTIWYGGSHFLDGQQSATAARVINESQQLVGAIEYYKASNLGNLPSSLNDLVTGNYLRTIPQNISWEIIDDYLITRGLAQTECEEVNRRMGYELTSVPLCTDPGIAGRTICCQG